MVIRGVMAYYVYVTDVGTGACPTFVVCPIGGVFWLPGLTSRVATLSNDVFGGNYCSFYLFRDSVGTFYGG